MLKTHAILERKRHTMCGPSCVQIFEARGDMTVSRISFIRSLQ